MYSISILILFDIDRLPETKHVYGANVVIFEGIFGLYDKRILELMDLKIFVDTDDDIRLARRCTFPIVRFYRHFLT
jgi:uridine kinase